MKKSELDTEQERFLKIFESRSEYYSSSGVSQEFREGKVSQMTQQRIKSIKRAFEVGFLEKTISDLQEGRVTVNMDLLDQDALENISIIVNSVTSEVGRALVALTVMQLSIKSIAPEQNIRLHKGSLNSKSFSWVDGISMRALDKNFVTPVLRKYNLLKLNADGFMMTRSLAENYPYTKLYKAKLRGARDQWLNIVELVEAKSINPFPALQYLVSLLLNKAADFNRACDSLLEEKDKYLLSGQEADDVIQIILTHIESSNYAARLMEVAMHSLMQAVLESGILLDYELKPLSQMRSANKKHGNIGDIELLGNSEIVEAWDAKFGKNYLRDEIDELSEKLALHDQIERAGFVTTDIPVRNQEITAKTEEVKELHGLEIEIMSFESWVLWNFKRAEELGFVSARDLSGAWLTAYTESLGQKRREMAPIDEPCFDWVVALKEVIKTH